MTTDTQNDITENTAGIGIEDSGTETPKTPSMVEQLTYAFKKNLIPEFSRMFTSFTNEVSKKINDNFNKNPNELKETINMGDNDSMNEEIKNKLNDIEKENIAIKKDVEWLSKTFLPAIISLAAILVTVIIFGYNSLNSNVNSKFDQINTSMNKNMELINQKLDAQKEINRLQIKSDVQEEFLKQGKK